MEIRPTLSALMRSKTGAILVALQVAISLGILANALHVVSQRQSLMTRPSGLADESAVFHLNVKHLPDVTHEEELATQLRETAVLRAVPGVASVAITNQTPLSNSGNTNGMFVDRKQTASSAQVSSYVSPDSLIQTWGLKLVQGRDFTSADVQAVDAKTSRMEAKVVIVTEALAQKVFPGAVNVLDKTVLLGSGETAIEMRIVGVVARLQSANGAMTEAAEYASIVPFRTTGNNASIYTLRAEPGQRDRVMKEAEAALRKGSVMPLLIDAKTMQQDRIDHYHDDTSLVWMLVAVSGLLLLITASGIVGMTALRVSQRRKQIGIRRALGARRIDILNYFQLENFMVTSVGIALGVLLALGLNAMLVSQLEMVRLPALYLAVGAGALLVLCDLAVLVPAWRGACISPANATRNL
jgi:putative ABC transport system permease protein